MKLSRSMLRQLIKEELSRLTEEPVSFVGASPGVHPPRGFSKNLESEGSPEEARKLGANDAMDGNPEKTEAELRALGYTHNRVIEAYHDGFEQGIHDKGFMS